MRVVHSRADPLYGFVFPFIIFSMIQRGDGVSRALPSQRYRFYDPPRFFLFPHRSSLLASYPVAFQVVVIYDNTRIVSRIQSRLVLREMGSNFLHPLSPVPLRRALVSYIKIIARDYTGRCYTKQRAMRSTGAGAYYAIIYDSGKPRAEVTAPT